MGQNTSRLFYLAKRKEKKRFFFVAVVAGVAGGVLDSRSVGNID